MTNMILKKNKLRVLVKTHFKTLIQQQQIRALWFWCDDTQIEIKKTLESAEVGTPHYLLGIRPLTLS